MKKIRLAIAGFTACSGCQLTLLNCENELLQIAEHFEFAYFPLACSPALIDGLYDVALIEGSVSSENEVQFLRQLRKQSSILIALGTCAAWGGIPAMPLVSCSPETPDESSLKPIHSFVAVDGTLYGCPPEKHELLTFLSDVIRGVLPPLIDYPVCTECKMRENLCLLTERKQLCLGVLTLGGCNARCPSSAVPCEGCRGPVPEANLRAALLCFEQHGYSNEIVMERLKRFHAGWKA